MAKAIDIGTCFIVCAEMRGGREVFTVERDAFFSMPKEDFAEEMLDEAGAKYLVRGDQLFVVGEDALRYCMLTGNQAAYRRPMAKGVLNPGEEEAISMLELLVEGIVGKPSEPDEVIAATCPAEPVGEELEIQFHRVVIERLLKRLGYDVHLLNEALALIYAENPSVETNGQTVPFTGIGISFGAGMTNLVVAWRAKKLFEISVARGGDWIDKKVAAVRGIPVGKVAAIKEKKFDLRNVNTREPIEVALEIYYEDLVKHTLGAFNDYFRRTNSVIDEPLEIVIGGGTAAVPGFIEMFRTQLAAIDLPVPIKGARVGKDPLQSVAAGALVAAMSFEKKKKAKAGGDKRGGGAQSNNAGGGARGGVPKVEAPSSVETPEGVEAPEGVETPSN